MLQQLYHCQSALAETCDDEWTALVATGLEVIEGCADIGHSQAGALIDGILVLSEEGIDGGVAIKRRIEAIAGRHIGCHLIDLERAHVLAMKGIPHIGIMAGTPQAVLPIFLPRRDHVEDIGACAVGIAISGDPHGGVIIVGRLRDEYFRRLIGIRLVRGTRHRTANEDGSYRT